jgi:hypothetical protein
MVRNRVSLRGLFMLTGFCAILSAIAPFFITGYHDLWTCALCRSFRTDFIYLGKLWRSEISETTCTQWYRDNVEPEHDHIWVHGRASALRDLYGNRFGAIDRDPVGRTIWRLSPEDQISFYQHFSNPNEGKSVFLNLANPNTKTNNKDFDILNQLLAWKESGFAKSWKDASNGQSIGRTND